VNTRKARITLVSAFISNKEIVTWQIDLEDVRLRSFHPVDIRIGNGARIPSSRASRCVLKDSERDFQRINNIPEVGASSASSATSSLLSVMMRERAQGHDIILFLANCNSNLTQNRWGERGSRKKKTPATDSLTRSDRYVQQRIAVEIYSQQRRQQTNDSCTLQLLQKVYKFEENPPEHKGSANAIGIV
jgi:hypothetical protein